MSTRKPQNPAPLPAGRQRPMHTRKSAWKLGWPIARAETRDLRRAEPVPG
jgi:hypothetical protein